MPSGDRTGPMGMGSRTGRAAGYCAGYGAPGYTNRAFGRGCGMGMGRGGGRRGWRNRFFAIGLPGWVRALRGEAAPSEPAVRGQTLETLKDQARSLEGMLADVKRRMEELEGAAAKK